MKTYGGSGCAATSFLTLALDWVEWSASHPLRFTSGEIVPGTHWTGIWMGPRAGLGAAETREISFLYRESNTGRQARIPSLCRLGVILMYSRVIRDKRKCTSSVAAIIQIQVTTLNSDYRPIASNNRISKWCVDKSVQKVNRGLIWRTIWASAGRY
jgi:hypothetical protein